jgi:hypothetical protein
MAPTFPPFGLQVMLFCFGLHCSCPPLALPSHVPQVQAQKQLQSNCMVHVTDKNPLQRPHASNMKRKEVIGPWNYLKAVAENTQMWRAKWNICDGAWLADSDVERCFIIRKLIDFIFNLRWEPESPHRISCWVHTWLLFCNGAYFRYDVYKAKTLHSAHTVYLCVPCGSHNKQRLFPWTALTGWALLWRRNVVPMRYGLNIIYI